MAESILWLLAIGLVLTIFVVWMRARAQRHRRVNPLENLPVNDGVGIVTHRAAGMGAAGMGAPGAGTIGDAGGCIGGSGSDCG